MDYDATAAAAGRNYERASRDQQLRNKPGSKFVSPLERAVSMLQLRRDARGDTLMADAFDTQAMPIGCRLLKRTPTQHETL